MLNRKILQSTVTTQFVREWMGQTTAVSLLSLFDQVCNLVNQAGEVISLVTPRIGPGPFAIVVPANAMAQIGESANAIRIVNNALCIGPLEIDIMSAKLWQPRPNWEAVRQQRGDWTHHLNVVANLVSNKRAEKFGGNTAVFTRLRQVESELIGAWEHNQIELFRRVVRQIAGLGPGLTPSGDDFLMGMLYGLWAARPKEEVLSWAGVVVETAVPRTTTLSAAWLKAAARGEAAAFWHELVQALVDNGKWETAVQHILAVGHSSGADALAGFVGGAGG